MKFENIVKFNWQDNSQLFFSLKHIFNYDFTSMQNYCYFVKTKVSGLKLKPGPYSPCFKNLLFSHLENLCFM